MRRQELYQRAPACTSRDQQDPSPRSHSIRPADRRSARRPSELPRYTAVYSCAGIHICTQCSPADTHTKQHSPTNVERCRLCKEHVSVDLNASVLGCATCRSSMSGNMVAAGGIPDRIRQWTVVGLLRKPPHYTQLWASCWVCVRSVSKT